MRGRRKDGIEFPLEITSSTIETPEGALGLAFVSDITERTRMDRLLRQRERELDMLVENVPDAIMRCNRQGRFTFVNSVLVKATGLTRKELLGKNARELGMPIPLCELWEHALERVFQTKQPETIEFSFPAPGGETFWEERLIPEIGPDGTMQSALLLAREGTEKRYLEKIAEARSIEVRALAGRLLAAQEEERRRVSRDLHDGLCQQLASLAFDVGDLAAHTASADPARERLQAVQTRVIQAAEAARHLAYELHPSVLDDLGLAASLKVLCDEFVAKRKVAVRLNVRALPGSLSLEVASNIYRVVQEALQNITKHAKAKHVTVEVAKRKKKIHLSIADDGTGFDAEAAHGRGGMGMMSMAERARLMNGQFSVDSTPGGGTRLTLVVPLA